MEFGRLDNEYTSEQESEMEVFSVPSVREKTQRLHGAEIYPVQNAVSRDSSPVTIRDGRVVALRRPRPVQGRNPFAAREFPVKALRL